MNYKETFEDEGFVYELNVASTVEMRDHLYTLSQGDGYLCQWLIKGKQDHSVGQIAVTDDNCELIVFHSVEDAVKGAREFLNI